MWFKEGNYGFTTQPDFCVLHDLISSWTARDIKVRILKPKGNVKGNALGFICNLRYLQATTWNEGVLKSAFVTNYIVFHSFILEIRIFPALHIIYENSIDSKK